MVTRARRAPRAACRNAVRRAAANAVDRARPCFVAEASHAGRAFDGPRAGNRGFHFRSADRNSAAIRPDDPGYVLEAGRVVLEGNNQTLRADDLVRRAYLGM